MKTVAVPLLVVGIWLPCSALAQRSVVDVVTLRNRDAKPHVIEYRVGSFRDCDRNRRHGATRTLPAKSAYTLRVDGDPFVCIRRPGGKWYRSDLRGKRGAVELSISY